MAAISILNKYGFSNDCLVNINGGFNEIKNLDIGTPILNEFNKV